MNIDLFEKIGRFIGINQSLKTSYLADLYADGIFTVSVRSLRDEQIPFRIYTSIQIHVLRESETYENLSGAAKTFIVKPFTVVQFPGILLSISKLHQVWPSVRIGYRTYKNQQIQEAYIIQSFWYGQVLYIDSGQNFV